MCMKLDNYVKYAFLITMLLLCCCADDGVRDNPTDPMASNYVASIEPSDDDTGSDSGDDASSPSSTNSGKTSSSGKSTPASSSSKASSSSIVINIEVVPPCNVDGEDNCEYGELTDSRDGAVYKTVVIGEQRWMAENLDYIEPGSEKLSIYGRAYTWAMAMDSLGKWSENSKGCGQGMNCSPEYPVRGVCPEGWFLPDSVAWATLLYSVGGPSVAGKNLKRTAANSYGFSAELAGMVNFYGEIVNAGTQAIFWSSSDAKYYASRIVMTSTDDKSPLRGDSDKDNLLPIRCFQDASTPAEDDSSPTESGEE